MFSTLSVLPRGWHGVRFTRRKVVAGVLTLSVIGTGIGSLAQTIDTVTNTADFSVTHIDMQANGLQDVTASFRLTGASGQAESFFEPLTLSNVGNTQLRYSGAATATGTLATKLKWQAFAVSSAANCNMLTYSGQSTFLTAGTQPVALGGNGWGAATPGQDTGDRLLNAGASEVICLYFSKDGSQNIVGTDTGQQVLTLRSEAVTS